MTFQLLKPQLEYLPHYAAALERGWSPDNLRGVLAAQEMLKAIAEDPIAFIHSLDDIEAKGAPITLPDGSLVPRLPSYHRWMWDGEFCGSIGFRWQPGTSALPPYVLGHVGYGVVPWKRGRGYARQALRLLLPEIRLRGLSSIDITTDLDNHASQRVITGCGGVLIERFHEPQTHGGREGLRYRIDL